MDSDTRSIYGQALSISLAVAPFGVAFGVLCRQADFHVLEAIGFSAVVFSGSAQFAAAGVLNDGGSIVAAVVAGALLNLRSLAFGVIMAPALHGPRWWRAATSQLMIDESTAVGSAQATPRLQRLGYLAGGLAVFVLWNLATIVGFVALGETEGLIESAGIDATIPAAFLALLWPRLRAGDQRAVALFGAGIAIATAPLLPPGLPIIIAAAAILPLRPWRRER